MVSKVQFTRTSSRGRHNLRDSYVKDLDFPAKKKKMGETLHRSLFVFCIFWLSRSHFTNEKQCIRSPLPERWTSGCGHQSQRSILLCSWPAFSPQFNIEIQSDGGRGSAKIVSSRMSECVSAGRSPPKVSPSFIPSALSPSPSPPG